MSSQRQKHKEVCVCLSWIFSLVFLCTVGLSLTSHWLWFKSFERRSKVASALTECCVFQSRLLTWSVCTRGSSFWIKTAVIDSGW